MSGDGTSNPGVQQHTYSLARKNLKEQLPIDFVQMRDHLGNIIYQCRRKFGSTNKRATDRQSAMENNGSPCNTRKDECTAR